MSFTPERVLCVTIPTMLSCGMWQAAQSARRRGRFLSWIVSLNSAYELSRISWHEMQKPSLLVATTLAALTAIPIAVAPTATTAIVRPSRNLDQCSVLPASAFQARLSTGCLAREDVLREILDRGVVLGLHVGMTRRHRELVDDLLLAVRVALVFRRDRLERRPALLRRHGMALHAA